MINSNKKNFLKKLVIFILVVAFFVAGVVFLFDPFFHYHKPIRPLKAVLTQAEYQVIGTLRTFDYDSLIAVYPLEQSLIEGIYDLIVETVICGNDKILIASNWYPTELVKSKFLKLTYSHIEYVLESMRKTTSKIANIKKYMLASLFNAPTTIDGYYRAEVNHDMPQFAV